MVTTLKDLPSELLIHILSFLRFEDVLNVQSVSKQFDRLVRSSLRLQYIIELGASGYVNNPLDPSSTEERLRLLYEHQDAWKGPHLRVSRTMPIIGHGDYRKYSRGMFMRLNTDASPGFHSLDVLDIISPENRSWTVHTDFDFSTDCEIDPEQDLLVLPHVVPVQQESSLEIALLSLTHGTIHPRAALSPVRVGFDDWDMPLCTSVQVDGDVVALSVYTRRFAHKLELVILEWTSGIVKMRLPQPADRVLRDFHLVSPRWLLVASVTRYPGRLPAVDVYSLDHVTSLEEGGGAAVPTRIATYELPCPRPQHVARIRITGDTSWRHHKLPGSEERLGIPFGTSRLNSVIYITMRVVESIPHLGEERRQRVFDIFTPLSTFLPSSPSLSKISDGPSHVSWSEWGPRRSRWFRDLTMHHATTTHGHRVIWPDRIWDFNPTGNARDIFRTAHMSYGHHRERSVIHEDATVIEADNIFQEDVISYLPYRETVMTPPLHIQGVSSTNGLIGWNITDDGLDVHVFEGLELPPLYATV